MNNFNFTGNLGGDCRVGSTGTATVVNFTVAVKSGFGDKAQTLWVDCSLWGKQAEGKLPEYLVKGQQVAIHGELGQREKDGKTYLTCRVNGIDLVGGRSDAQPATHYQPQQQPQGQQQPYQPPSHQSYQQAPRQAPPAQQPPAGFDNYDDINF